MAGTMIKIVSNPYKEQVEFLTPTGDAWTAINPNSRLLSEKLVGGFFPFKAEEIVRTTLKEFGGAERIHLVFEGSDDEWRELEAI
ncbi:MAG: hypothetical protein Q4B45_04070 [Coriobacteriia bacterium]|nr:hypothetical protein [Coriobacteriia bacterium]